MELQADFERFKQHDQRRMWELRDAITNLEARVNLLRPRASTESWEAVSDRVASEVSRMSEALNERMVPEIGRAIQTHTTHPRRHRQNKS